MATRKPTKQAPTYVLTHFCTPGFNTQPKKKRNILKSFFIHMQTDVAQLLPRCRFTRSSPSCTANEHKFPPLHKEKRCTIAQREVAKTNACLPAEFGEDFVKEEG